MAGKAYYTRQAVGFAAIRNKFVMIKVYKKQTKFVLDYWLKFICILLTLHCLFLENESSSKKFFS